MSAVSYATTHALTNCGVRTLESKVPRFLAMAGSWMSRTTTVGSPATVPMTRLTAAGTGRAQRTRVAGPGAPTGAGNAAFDGVMVGAVGVEGVEGVGVAVGDDTPHASST